MKRSRIIMVYPLQGFSGAYVKHTPLSLLYASIGIVKRGVEVAIFDQRLRPNTWREDLAEMLGDDVLAVGISVMSGAPINNAIAIGRHVKALDPDIAVVWGGPHVTFHPTSVLADEESCDYTLSGYAAEAFDTLVATLERGDTVADVPGVGWRDDGAIRLNQPNDTTFEYVDYRDIPYHLIDDYSPYGQLEDERRIFSMYSAVGCPYLCSFCSSPAQYSNIKGRRWVMLDASEVVDHVQFLVDRYGANYIYFIDDDSFPKLSHVEGIIDEMAARGLTGKVKLGFRGARINEIKRMDDAFLTKLADAGTDIMHIGAESGSDRILKLIRKDCTADDIIACNRKLARHPEITAAYNFMMGVPTETLDELKSTRDLMWRLAEDHPNCIIFPPNKFRPLPSTELYDMAEKEWGYKMPESLADWANIEVEGDVSDQWYDDKMRRFCNLMLLCSYFIDNKIARVTKGKTLFYKLMRLANLLYRPIARFRLKHGLSRFLVEYHIYQFLTGVLARRQSAD
jgi:anaerobic magnesium-protoporphyrin IX monomethyl ester cyclase